jgi:hypothetical protein
MNNCLFIGLIYRDANGEYYAAEFWLRQIGHHTHNGTCSCMTIKSTLFNTLGLIALFPFGSQATPVEWSSIKHHSHFADVNGDGIKDLILQAKKPEDDSSVIFGCIFSRMLITLFSRVNDTMTVPDD